MVTLSDLLKGGAKKTGGTGNEQTASALHTATAAETAFTTVAASLAAGATGRPLVLTAYGSVGGIVQIQFGSQAVYSLLVGPNAAPVHYPIPPTAFPNKVNSVNVMFQADGVGTLHGIVAFEVD